MSWPRGEPESCPSAAREGGGEVVHAAALAVGEVIVPQEAQVDPGLQDVPIQVLVQRSVDLEDIVRVVDASARLEPSPAKPSKLT